LARGGLYARYWKRQSGGFIDTEDEAEARVTFTIERLGHLGHGIAAGPAGPLFVPGVLPGEVVTGDPAATGWRGCGSSRPAPTG
jgi:hypothetical protein